MTQRPDQTVQTNTCDRVCGSEPQQQVHPPELGLWTLGGCDLDKRLTRREALERLSAGALLVLGLWPGALRAGDAGAGGTFRFLVVNDLHYMTPECGRWLEGVMRQMRAEEGVELCLVAGDLCEYGTAAELGGVRDVLKTLGLPVYTVIGNHDYTAPAPADRRRRGPRLAAPRFVLREPLGSQPMADRRYYERFFPKQLNYWFEHRGWQFIGLDTTQGLRYQNTRIQDPTFAWVRRQLAKWDPRKPTVVFTHFPLGPSVTYRPQNADALLDLLRPLNLRAVFCGHWHGFTERRVGNVILTTNRCCALKRGNHDGTRQKGYFVCTARDGQISRQFVAVN
jgi:hypothetical protein